MRKCVADVLLELRCDGGATECHDLQAGELFFGFFKICSELIDEYGSRAQRGDGILLHLGADDVWTHACGFGDIAFGDDCGVSAREIMEDNHRKTGHVDLVFVWRKRLKQGVMLRE